VLNILFGWLENSIKYQKPFREIFFFISIAILFLSLRWFIKKKPSTNYRNELFLKIVAYLNFSIFFVIILFNLLDILNVYSNTTFQKYTKLSLFPIFNYSHLVIPLFTILYSVYLLVFKQDSKWKNLFLLNSGLILGSGFSGGIGQYGLFLALPTLTLILVEQLRDSAFLKSALFLLLAIWIAGLNVSWIQSPYSWWGYQTSNTKNAVVKSTYPFTEGLRLDAQSKKMYDQIMMVLNENSRCERNLLTFPSMTTFGLDAGYRPYANNVQYWYDFSSSDVVINAIAQIKTTPPPAILYTRYPDYVAQWHSILFNHNLAYPQAKLEKEIQHILKTNYSKTVLKIPSSQGILITVGVLKSCL
jgi:hypothetical protein